MISFLQIDNVSKAFGDLVLFENISFLLAKEQKIALVAKNGAGKTTLFNILCGKDTPDTGTVTFHKDITISFLEQDPEFDENKTVLQQVFSSSGEVIDAIMEYETALSSDDKGRLQASIEKMDKLEAWNYEATIKGILSKLKISGFDQKMGTLSGGQRKRVALANALVREPDLLILDEPTNHLDFEMIEWFEEYLKKSSITLLMVTHDRYFLDRVCNEVIEIDNKRIFRYAGNYTKFLEKREERITNENQNAEKARNLLRRELEWIRRTPSARTGKAKARIDSFYELKDQAVGRANDKLVNLNVKGSRLGTKIVDIKNLTKNFGPIKILDKFSYNFIRYEKVGVIGNNGTGKTTFLNMLTGKEPYDSGVVDMGETVVPGYYRQDGMSFNEQMKVIDVAREIAEVVIVGNGVRMSVSAFLNYFMFPPEVQHSFVYKLSGGEKRRLYLATVLMKNPNLLILDEPTNDLDILTLNVFEEYLADFAGSVIIVSHDRYFMDKVVDHLFVFEGDGNVSDFPGNYTQYREHRDKLERQAKRQAKAVKKDEPEILKTEKSGAKKLSYKEQKEFDQLGADIEQLETEYKRLELLLGSGSLSNDEVIETSVKLGEMMKAIEDKTNRWLELSEIAEG
ncbi:MAG: ABC-F family ATP-binding cassette domain-containing protein [Bacteroidota bacterium]